MVPYSSTSSSPSKAASTGARAGTDPKPRPRRSPPVALPTTGSHRSTDAEALLTVLMIYLAAYRP